MWREVPTLRKLHFRPSPVCQQSLWHPRNGERGISVVFETDRVSDFQRHFDHHVFPGGVRQNLPHLVAQPKPKAGSRHEPVSTSIRDSLALLYKLPHQALISFKGQRVVSLSL